MLSNATFGFGLMKKYMVIFGSLFNDIEITRTIANNQTQIITIPLSYANKEKMLVRDLSDPDLNKQSAITLPRMSYEMLALGYDGERNNPGIMKRATLIKTDSNSMNFQYSGVPYNMIMSLYIYVKNMSDGTKIVEQILPFFQPDYTVTCNLIPENNVTVDIPIIYNGIKISQTTSNNFADKQVTIWELSFTVKGWFYGPVREKKIIKFINVNTREATSNTIVGTYSIRPGLDANGNPTTMANSISYSNMGGGNFKIGETVNIFMDDDTIDGFGTVTFSDGNTLTLDNTSGTVVPPQDGTIRFVDEQNGNEVSMLSSDDLVVNTSTSSIDTNSIFANSNYGIITDKKEE